jgi:hypothetical protein
MGFFHQKNGIFLLEKWDFLVINGRVAKRKRLMAKIRGRVGRVIRGFGGGCGGRVLRFAS